MAVRGYRHVGASVAPYTSLAIQATSIECLAARTVTGVCPVIPVLVASAHTGTGAGIISATSWSAP